MRKIKESSILIAASGYSEDPVIAKPKEFGFNDSLIKPFRRIELMDLLNRVFINYSA